MFKSLFCKPESYKQGTVLSTRARDVLLISVVFSSSLHNSCPTSRNCKNHFKRKRLTWERTALPGLQILPGGSLFAIIRWFPQMKTLKIVQCSRRAKTAVSSKDATPPLPCPPQNEIKGFFLFLYIFCLAPEKLLVKHLPEINVGLEIKKGFPSIIFCRNSPRFLSDLLLKGWFSK